MAAADKSVETQVAGIAVKAVEEPAEVIKAVMVETKKAKREQPKAEEEEEKVKVPQEAKTLGSFMQKNSSFKEESNFLSDLKYSEKKALMELRGKVEEAILKRKLFKKEDRQEKRQEDKKERRQPDGEGEEDNSAAKEKAAEAIDKDISLWGVPLRPSKCPERNNVVLLKFLRAREFKVKEAFEMLQNTLQWRKESAVDSILNEDSLGADFANACYMDGVDREGRPVCYNVHGVFQDEDLYMKAFGTEEKREQFVRWRVQLMEKGIQKLDFKPGSIASFVNIIDLKNSPGPSKKELRLTINQAVELLQNNYPEFVAKNIFINVPFWYYAFNALLSPFLTQRTRSKFVSARSSKVTETLLKYIPAGNIPVCYGGLKRENETEFSADDGRVTELRVKAGSTENVEIPVPEVGTTFIWDLTVLGWEVNYKEEFIPTDERSYTIIIQKGKKMGAQGGPVRNSFKNNEPGKVVISIENTTFKKKKVLFRCKAKSS
ncbi:patellin-4-like [Phoenix dactylifera]|uniref:Patellin-4-like n=1 Tax=Phoenix dactylifera TaxID=42345 RepID=A0A8B7C805_PHODC|nr:patellin-4-like [Phoenix dactylifera]